MGRGLSAALVALPALPVLFGLACAAPGVVEEQAATTAAPLRVATYNLNYGLGGDPEEIKAIVATDADIVLLQEVTPAWSQALTRSLASRYPYRHFVEDRAAGGLGVLSRYPFEAQLIDNPVSWFPAMLVQAETPMGPVQALNVHLRPPFSDSGSLVAGYFTTRSVRRAELEHFCSALRPGLPTLVAGDFNEGDGPASRLLRSLGLVDAIEEGARGESTWRWRTPLGQLRQTLDHIYYQRERFVLVTAAVLPLGRSDHLPAVAELRARR